MYTQDQAWLSHGYKHWLVNGQKWNDESDDESDVGVPVDDCYGYVHISKRQPTPASDEPLTGFTSQGGSDMVTNGILMWGKPFILTNQSNGEKVMISFRVSNEY